jgi:hypothetical protein
MKTLFNKKSKFLASSILITLLLSSLLVGCSGRTVIDVNIDPETGEGNIVVDPAAQPEDDGGQDTDGAAVDSGTPNNPQMSQIALFAVIAALFIGVVAIVIAVQRRPSDRERVE